MLVNGYGRKGGGFVDWYIPFFISLFANGEFDKFGLSGMEGGSRGVVIITLQVSFGGGRGGRMGLVKGVIIDIFHAS